MKVAIISDTHDNLANLEKFLSFAKEEKIKAVFHCGDVTKPETLDYFLSTFPGEIFLCLGNADLKDEITKKFSKHERLKFFDGVGEVNLDNKKFIFSHFLENIENRLKGINFAFFGHTHKPWFKNIDPHTFNSAKELCETVGHKKGVGVEKTIILNPGNLAGLYYSSTFAVLDLKTEVPRLKLLEKI